MLLKEPLGDVLSTIFRVAALDVWLLTCEYAPNPRLVEEEPCVRLESWEFWSAVERFLADDASEVGAAKVRLAVSTPLFVPPNNPMVSIIVEP